jgi:nicotinate-nucleotide adenylyltransferase
VAESVVQKVSVGLFGGSFNPPHVGHVLSIAYVLSTGLVQRVVAVPVYAHALGKSLAPFAERLNMARLAFEWLPRVEVSDIEQGLGTPSRTLGTVRALLAQHPEWQLRLVVGSDILGELHQWHAYREIERLAPPLILPRPGAPEPGQQEFSTRLLPDISSTEVRALLADWASGTAPGAEVQLERLVPQAVLSFIRQHGLYGVPAQPQ